MLNLPEGRSGRTETLPPIRPRSNGLYINRFAAAQPLPLVPPATTAVLPSNPPMANHSSDLGLTTVDEEFTASDVTAFVGGKERDRFGDLIRGSRSAQRNRRCDGLDVIIHLLLRQTKAGVIARCRNDARTDRVDADTVALQVHGPIAGKRAKRRFGGAIDTEGRSSLDGNH